MVKKIVTVFFLSVLPFFIQAQLRVLPLDTCWKFRHAPDTLWYRAGVPGTIHTDLINNKFIPDPYFRDHEQQLQWIENEDWVYKAVFNLDPQQLNSPDITLVFEGLDTYATVSLNNKKLLEADNMFRTWRIEVKSRLKTGQNVLEIYFHSAVKKGKELASLLSYTLPGDEKVFTRKAQYQYGWDWGPRFVTCGIWRPVYLEFVQSVAIHDIQVIQQETRWDTARLQLRCQLKSNISGNAELKVREKNSAKLLAQTRVKLQKKLMSITVNAAIPEPRLWWPNGLGDPYLYDLVLEVSKENSVLDEQSVTTGLRSIELIQEPDSLGKSFYFKVNGTPVFIRGANFIPPDNFLTRPDSNSYVKLIQDAADCHMNMLRVWGGGVYENDLFYDLCDRYGILVWQDFMFACAMYPGDPAFQENVRQEARDNIKRLRNHPCLALWCGNNEISEGWKNWGWQKQYKYSPSDSATIWKSYLELFEHILPGIVRESDPAKPYWPSSPSIGWGHPESLLSGDAHYWGVWWGMEPFGEYEKKIGRFMSEYGFQGFPDISTINTFTDVEDNYLGSPAMKAHQKHPSGYETIDSYMKREYEPPVGLNKYSYVSQLLQAGGMQRAIEAHRRAKPYCMGTLYWQFNDCWPAVSWSGRDWYGRWKALQYTVKKAYEPFLVSITREKPGETSIYLINDGPHTKGGFLEIRLLDFNGNQLFFIAYRNIEVPTDENIVFPLNDNISLPIINKFGAGHCVLQAIFRDLDDKQYKANYFFTTPKELNLSHDISVDVSKVSDGEYEIELKAHKLAKNVWLQLDRKDAVFSDNYFDLLAGEFRVIRCSSPLKLESVIQCLRVKSLIHQED